MELWKTFFCVKFQNKERIFFKVNGKVILRKKMIDMFPDLECPENNFRGEISSGRRRNNQKITNGVYKTVSFHSEFQFHRQRWC